MKFQENIARTFVVFFKDPWTFVLATLFALIITVASLGILGPVMWLGMGEMFKKTKSGGKAAMEDLFIHMDKAIMLAVLGFLIAICVAIGSILIIPGVIIGAIWIYAIYFMAYKETGLMDSLKMSAAVVLRNSLMNHILMIVGIWLVMSMGASIVIGVFITFPICAGFMSFTFEEIKG